VFAGGQIVNGNKLASIGVEVNQLKVKLTENEVNQLTEKYFWQIVSLKEKTKTIDAIEAQLIEIHKTVKVAVQAGITTNNDLLKVELKQQSVESARLKVENGIKVSKILLEQHIGVRDSLFDISFSEFPQILSPVQFYASPNSAVLNRTESQLLDKSVEAAIIQKDMAIGKNYPVLAVGASYIYHDLLKNNTDFGMVFATVSVPISSWWGGSHAIKREELKLQQTQNTSQNAKEMMQVEIQAKWNELEEAYKQVLISEKSIISAKENLRISKDYYNAGISSLSDLLEAQTSLQNTLDQRTEAKTNYQTKLSSYLQVIGK
jgi:outer membrane protein TolC